MQRPRSASLSLALVALLATTASAQQTEVAGTVVDGRTGRPLDRVQVVAGTGEGVRTDTRGRFRIPGLTGTTVTLNVALIGYRPATQTATVGDQEVIIRLNEMAVNLGEIVVTGTVEGAEKRTIANSVASVRAAEVQDLIPSPDMSNLINSRAPGVVVIPGTGQIGSAPRIRIRGANSFSLTDQPLIYIDGVRVANDVSTGIVVQAFGSGVGGRLNDLDPDQIESIEIIKGPAAATLYGTEASNGVIQVITKKGKNQARPDIKLGLRFGDTWFMNPEGRLVKPISMIDGELVAWNAVAQEEALGNKLFRDGFGQGYTLSITGGTPVINYYAGATYDYDKGIEPTNYQKRFTANASIGITPSPKYDVNVSFGIVKNDVNQAFEAGAGGIWFSTVFGDAALVDTPYRGFLFGPPEYQWYSSQPRQLVNRFTVSAQINHRPAEWFSHRLIVGLDQTEEGAEQLNRYLPPEYVQFDPGVAALGGKYQQRRDIAYGTFDYAGSIKAKLSETIRSTTSIGGQIYRRRTDLVWANGDQFPAPGLETIAATAVRIGFDDYLVNTTVGVYVEEKVAFNEKLYVTGAVRVDNNSAFGENFDFVVYPKVGASYVLKEGATGTVSALRLRGAYGQSGQQPETFSALRSYQPVTGGDGSPAVIPQFVGNPNLKPERSTELELGFDAGFFNDRLSADFSFYSQTTKDAILLQSIAPSFGFPGTQFTNIGAIKNTGIELMLSGAAIQSDDVDLQLNFSLSHNSNEVTDLGEGISELNRITGPKVGFPVDAIFARKVIAATLNTTTGRAENVLCDDNNGGGVACGSAPGVYLGVYDPRYEGAFSGNLTLWKRLRLYALADFKAGNKHADNNRRALCQVFLRCDENFNPQNYDPLIIAELQSNNVARSWIMADASFIKLREVAAQYTLPRNVAGFLGGRDATIGISARNLHTWTSWTGLDPEAFFVSNLFTRLEQDQTPQLASVMFTVNITF